MSIKEATLKKADDVNISLQNSPIVKGLIDGGLSLIPFLGTAVTSALSTRAFQLFQDNSRRFAEALRTEIDRLNQEKLDKEFIESEEFTSLLLDVLSSNARTHEHEKTQLYARIFVNAATIDYSKIPFKEGFVRIVEELSVEHIRILAFIIQALSGRELTGTVSAQDIAEAVNTPRERVEAYCAQMVRFGLLRDQGTTHPYHFYMPTDYGLEFAAFLKEQV